MVVSLRSTASRRSVRSRVIAVSVDEYPRSQIELAAVDSWRRGTSQVDEQPSVPTSRKKKY